MYRIEPLAAHHDRTSFSCGNASLDRYLRTQAGQDRRRRLTSCFVAVDETDAVVAGYYTLCATGIALTELPPEIAKSLSRYPTIPAILLGRLAVDMRHRGRRLGELLLFDAFARTLRSEVASFAFVVDAKDEQAQAFYRRYRFRALTSDGRRLFVPVAEIAKLFA